LNLLQKIDYLGKIVKFKHNADKATNSKISILFGNKKYAILDTAYNETAERL
jgi:hypothetical protein